MNNRICDKITQIMSHTKMRYGTRLTQRAIHVHII